MASMAVRCGGMAALSPPRVPTPRRIACGGASGGASVGKQRVRLGSSSNSINGSVVAPAGRGGAGRSGGGRRLSVAVRAAKSSKSSKASQAAKAEAELAAAEEQLASEMAEAADADAVDGATAADANATASAAPAAPAAPAAAPPPLPRPPSQGTSKQYRSSGSSSPVQPAADFDITLVAGAYTSYVRAQLERLQDTFMS